MLITHYIKYMSFTFFDINLRLPPYLGNNMNIKAQVLIVYNVSETSRVWTKVGFIQYSMGFFRPLTIPPELSRDEGKLCRLYLLPSPQPEHLSFDITI